MRLYDGSAEYVRADEISAGDQIRKEGVFREVVDARREGAVIVVVCIDGYGFEAPPATRVLRKLDTEEV